MQKVNRLDSVRRRRGSSISCFAVLLLVFGCLLPAQGLEWPKNREARSLTLSRYAIRVQRDGDVDVISPAGKEWLKNLAPYVLLAGEEEADKLAVDGLLSSRVPVNNVLGEGHGFLFDKRNCQWVVESYVTQPFLTFRMVYRNNGRTPIQVARLIPLRGEIANAGQVYAIEDGGGLSAPEAEADSSIALAAAESGGAIVSGFLSSPGVNAVMRVSREADGAVLSAECIYDPPIELAPGESLQSQWCYVSLAEEGPDWALQRYARASALAAESTPAVPFLPMGLNPFAKDVPDSAAALMAAAELLPAWAVAAGWRDVPVRVPWDASEERLLALEEAITQLQSRGLRVICRLDLHALPQPVSAALPEAAAAVLRRLTAAGCDALALDFSPTPPPPGVPLTPLGQAPVSTSAVQEAVLQDAAAAIGSDVLLWARAPVLPAARYAAVVTPLDAGQDALAPASYLAPHRFHGHAHVSADANWEAAWMAAAMKGGAVTVDPALFQQPEARPLADRFRPEPELIARPRFAQRDVWILDAADGGVAAVFGAPGARSALYLDQAGLSAQDYYAVYDVTDQQYAGMGRQVLQVRLPETGARLLALRQRLDRPQLLCAGEAWHCGAGQWEEAKWNAAERVLEGSAAAKDGKLRLVLVLPDPASEWSQVTATVGGKEAPVAIEDTAAVVTATGLPPGVHAWEVRFR